MITHDRMGRRVVDGLLDMGKPRVPPLPPRTFMTDRTDGQVYLLAQAGDVGSLTPSQIVTSPTGYADKQVFGPFEGPYLSNRLASVRLYLDNGTLSGEVVTGNTTQSPRLFTRGANSGTVLEITLPIGWVAGDPFTYTEVTL